MSAFSLTDRQYLDDAALVAGVTPAKGETGDDVYRDESLARQDHHLLVLDKIIDCVRKRLIEMEVDAQDDGLTDVAFACRGALNDIKHSFLPDYIGPIRAAVGEAGES